MNFTRHLLAVIQQPTRETLNELTMLLRRQFGAVSTSYDSLDRRLIIVAPSLQPQAVPFIFLPFSQMRDVVVGFHPIDEHRTIIQISIENYETFWIALSTTATQAFSPVA